MTDGSVSLGDLLPPRPALAPRRRFRGQRRHYRQVERRMSEPIPDLEEWFDLWHVHADYPGYGNLSARHRRAHIALHCGFFRQAARELLHRAEPYQLFLYLDAQDAGRDAVYVHTPSPHGAAFPLWWEDAQWGQPEMTTILEGLCATAPLHVGRTPDGSFVAFAVGVGLPLVPP